MPGFTVTFQLLEISDLLMLLGDFEQGVDQLSPTGELQRGRKPA
ncbi:hypothetical protein M8J77_015369 [Diaphorina citri]|nr:hypothetical protein M8J77_015369 [Diaphorina citri]